MIAMPRLNTIHQGDVFDLLPRVPDKFVDLIICDGPYGVTQHGWDRVASIQEFNLDLIRQFARKLKDGGALYMFGKADCIDFIDYRPYLTLQRKIVWYQPSRLAQGRLNFTNNYDLICYFVKGRKPARFNLDEIRVAQLVELEHRLRCERVPSVIKGRFSKTKFNVQGKNPGDVWGDIKQLTYRSHELQSREVLNTIQKPEKLFERIILASSSPGDLVLDPFAGTGTGPAVCDRLGRDFIGFEKEENLVRAGLQRLRDQNQQQSELRFANG